MIIDKNEKKLKKKRNKKRFRIILISVVILYLIFRIIPTLHASKLETYTVEKGKIEIVEKLEGIVFRNEKIYKAKTSGEITYIKDEGARISVGERIAEISLDNDTEKMKEELREIEKELESLTGNTINENIFKGDINKNQKYIDSLAKEIQENILKKNYKKVAELRKKLNERLDKQKTLTGETGYNANNIKALKQRKEEILEMIKGSNIACYTVQSGIISYNIDSLEMIYSINRLNELYPENYKKIEQQIIKQTSGEKVKTGEPIYKIIDNYEWYIITKLNDSETIKAIEERKNVSIRLGKEESKKELRARIIKVNKTGNEAVVVLRFNKKLFDYYESRYVDFELILNRYEGLKIPTKSIVDNEGIKGVYIKGVGGITRFRAIKILGEDEEHTIVDEGKGINKSFIKINIDGKNENISTLSIYDEVIINGDKVEEGEIIN